MLAIEAAYLETCYTLCRNMYDSITSLIEARRGDDDERIREETTAFQTLWEDEQERLRELFGSTLDAGS